MAVVIPRRQFIAGLGGAAAASPSLWSRAARAQQPTMPIVGYLYSGSVASSEHLVAAFRQGLAETGYVEGRNVEIEFRSADNDDRRLPELVAALVRRRVAVIVTPGSLTGPLAAKAATTTIPVIFSMGGDPVATGLVASLNRPGGNVTGITSMNTEIAAKRLGLLRELLPNAERFAMLTYRKPITDPQVADAKAAAATMRSQMDVFTVASGAEFEEIFASLKQKRIDALLVTPGPLLNNNRVQLAVLAARHAIPAMFPSREFTNAGGLMSYGPSVTDEFRQAGIYTGSVLKGVKPADLPVYRAVKFEFVINLKTANTLGLEFPPALLALVDEVIE